MKGVRLARGRGIEGAGCWLLFLRGERDLCRDRDERLVLDRLLDLLDLLGDLLFLLGGAFMGGAAI